MPEPTPLASESARKHRRLVEQAARATWGSAWSLLSDEQRAGALALAALNHLAGQDASVGDAKVRALLLDLHALAHTDSSGQGGDSGG